MVAVIFAIGAGVLQIVFRKQLAVASAKGFRSFVRKEGQETPEMIHRYSLSYVVTGLCFIAFGIYFALQS